MANPHDVLLGASDMEERLEFSRRHLEKPLSFWKSTLIVDEIRYT